MRLLIATYDWLPDASYFKRGCFGEKVITVPIIIQFKSSHKIGYCKLFPCEDGLYMQANIPEVYWDMYPCLGIEVTVPTLSAIDVCEVRCVGLCTKRNVDPKIKTIRDQIDNHETTLH